MAPRQHHGGRAANRSGLRSATTPFPVSVGNRFVTDGRGAGPGGRGSLAYRSQYDAQRHGGDGMTKSGYQYASHV